VLRSLDLEGVSCHIGSQIVDTGALMEAVDKMLALVDRLRTAGLPIRHLDLGGGLGVAYTPGAETPDARAFAASVRAKVEGHGLTLLLEPGRSLVAEAGVLVTRVLYRKRSVKKEFIVVDAAMTDLIRPALYKAHHEIIPLRKTPLGTVRADVVGPVCETGDFLARDRDVANVLPGDYLAVCTAGAYGFVSASNYNARPRPPEILVEGAGWRVVRPRETFEDLVRGETA
jgi:diaminopimelate decarboxylase